MKFTVSLKEARKKTTCAAGGWAMIGHIFLHNSLLFG